MLLPSFSRYHGMVRRQARERRSRLGDHAGAGGSRDRRVAKGFAFPRAVDDECDHPAEATKEDPLAGVRASGCALHSISLQT